MRTSHGMRDASPILTRTDPPPRQARLAINRVATWYTWSPPVRSFLHQFARFTSGARLPPIRTIRGVDDYPRSFSLPLGTVRDPGLRSETRAFATALFRLPRPRGIHLLTGLFDDAFESRALRVLLACSRTAVAGMAGQDRGALYSPPSGDPRDRGFPLHADLWAAEMLMNIFDRPDAGPTGASVFLRIETLLALLRDIHTVPTEVRARIRHLLRGPHEDGAYEELFELLHGGANAWTPALERGMRRHQVRIKLERGQGYLIHDRTWLHGREPVVETVPAFRLHRLVFMTERTHVGPRWIPKNARMELF